jgi:hypothetical protein
VPIQGRDIITLIGGNVNHAGAKAAETTVKRRPAHDQIEAYNVTHDPLELTNLAHSTDPAVRSTLKRLKGMLERQCAAKRHTPATGEIPGQPAC